MLQGIFSSNSGINGEAVQSFSNKIYTSGFVGTAPMLALSSGMRKSKATSIIQHWFEDAEDVYRTVITNNAATGTTIVVAQGTVILPNTVVCVESTGEYMLVTAVSGNSLTVHRGFANTTVKSIDGSSTPVGLQIIAQAHKEGSEAPAAMKKVGYPVMNYTQIFRNTWSNTRTARQVDWHTGSRTEKNKRDCISKHAQDIENALLFGKKSLFSIDSEQAHTMEGLIGHIRTNVAAQDSGGLTYNDFEEFIANVFAHNIEGEPNERLAFAGNGVMLVLNQLARKTGQLNIVVGQNDFGTEINTIRTSFGTLKLLTHPLFNQSPVWTNNLVVFHPGAVELKYVEDATVQDSSNPGFDGDAGTITSELTMEYHCEKTAGILTGINKAA